MSPSPRGKGNCFIWPKNNLVFLALALLLLWLASLPSSYGQSTGTTSMTPTVAPTGATPSLDFNNFPQCNLTTQEMAALTAHDNVEPCILFDLQSDLLEIIPYRTMTVTLVQVTPATRCEEHRDGAATSIELLNQVNGGKGIAIGFHKDYFIQFRLVSLIAGNAYSLGEAYGPQHTAVLDAALGALKPQYIVGTCSFASSYEQEPAKKHQTMLMAMVGPPSYYETNNPYIFGAHINSDEYPIFTVRALGFRAAQTNAGPEAQSVRVIYRKKSEFFYSTCKSAVSALQQFGFTDLVELEYDPEADDNGDGTLNESDEDFLRGLADQACPPGSGDKPDFNPALFACVLTEQDIILQRWRENGCRPSAIWLTAATWAWATSNPDVVPYMQGGAQWHEAFTYSDRFFESGKAVLNYTEHKYGYHGSYDTVVSYSIPLIYTAHLESAYRVVDDPDPVTDFSTADGYERLRRALIIINTETIFGPVQFNKYQRNSGRETAGTQWLSLKKDGDFQNALVSPLSQAEAEVVIPAESAQNCSAGNYVNETLISTGLSLLQSKCGSCPADSFTAEPNKQLQCHACLEGSSTGGGIGQKYCVHENDHLLSAGTLAFGYVAVCITWLLSLSILAWLMIHRNDPVVRISQIEFMVLICVGAIISSSTIIALSWQVGSQGDTDSASMACRAAPFLYTIGWVLQYGSLSAKSFRLHKIMSHPQMQRVTVTFSETVSFLIRILVLDLIVVVVWTVIHPLEYIRSTTSVEVDDATHIMTINTVGHCKIVDGPSIWSYIGPLVGIHAILMITTNVILYKVRNVGDRYQEQKYVALASIFVFEVLVIGLPVIIAVGNSPGATFIVFTGIIALNDIGILCFVFLPKIKYQRKGLDEGVGVGETILKGTHRKATYRESMRRSASNASAPFSSGISGSGSGSGVEDKASRNSIISQVIAEESERLDDEEVGHVGRRTTETDSPGSSETPIIALVDENQTADGFGRRSNSQNEDVETENQGDAASIECEVQDPLRALLSKVDDEVDQEIVSTESEKLILLKKENEKLRREIWQMKNRESQRQLRRGLEAETKESKTADGD